MTGPIEALRGVYVVTDGKLAPGRSHIDIAKASIDAGACCVQLRDSESSDRVLFEIAARIQEMARGSGTVFVVNNRADIAAAVGADGLHVGQDDLPASAARAIIGPDAILGVSVTSVEEALRAQADGADYVAPGPIYSTATKLDAAPVTGLALITQIREAVKVPVVAIGGIGLANIAEVAAAGAASAAVVSAVVCADDMAAAILALRQEFARGEGLSC